jgi:selT/selW/selH-like putative selenoprotein
LAAEIKKELGVDSQLVRGSGGIFDVSVNDKKIYSKYDSGKFPAEKDIIEQLRKLA